MCKQPCEDSGLCGFSEGTWGASLHLGEERRATKIKPVIPEALQYLAGISENTRIIVSAKSYQKTIVDT